MTGSPMAPPPHDRPCGSGDFAVVIPTIGQAGLAGLIRTAAGPPAPAEIVVVDDRATPQPPMDLAGLTSVPVRVVRSGGRGPAAARNAGWLATTSEWVAFLDDDVAPGPDWCAALTRDLTGLPDRVGASYARIHVPPPAGRRPTDEERRTLGLESARWITADAAFRRSALLATGGFDERFPRAFREDCDLALRTLRAGFLLVSGTRTTEHPIRARGGWTASLRAQAGNADNALLRTEYGPGWRQLIGDPGGRIRWHLATVAAAAVAVAGAGRPTLAGLGTAAWLGLTADFARRRILPGPRTAREVTTMLATSVAIPPLAVGYRAAGEVRARRPHQRASRIRAVLFDRDGTLIHDVPYATDPERVVPVECAARTLAHLRRRGIKVGVISNQSGLGRGLIRPDQLAAVNRRVETLLGPFDTWQICPHAPGDGCPCRKPLPGLVFAAARQLGVDPRECAVIGDIGADVRAALGAGAHPVLVPTEVTDPSEVAFAGAVADVAGDLADAVDHVLARAR